MGTSTEANETRQRLLTAGRSLMVTKGYTAVGLAEIVAMAGVPKGSFYYYFDSKEDFGQTMLADYFQQYAARADASLSGPGTARERLLAHFSGWASSQSSEDLSGRCIATKLGAEVCDLSEGMRRVLDQGAKHNVARLSRTIEDGLADKSIRCDLPAPVLAKALYELWSGASLMAKLDGTSGPFDTAMTFTKTVI